MVNRTFSLGCVPLIMSGSLNWHLFTKNIRSVHRPHAKEVTIHFDVTVKKITPVLKISTYITTSITACPIRLSTILAVMSVLTFKTADFHIYIVLDKKSRSKGIRHAFFQHLEINYIDFDRLWNSFHGYLLKTY